jgi:Flp pilus assembly protein TadB
MLIKLTHSSDTATANQSIDHYLKMQNSYGDNQVIDSGRKQSNKEAGLAFSFGLVALGGAIALLSNPIGCAIFGAVAITLLLYAAVKFGEAAMLKKPNQAAIDLGRAIRSCFQRHTKKSAVSIFAKQAAPISDQENYERAVFPIGQQGSKTNPEANAGTGICSRGRSATV